MKVPQIPRVVPMKREALGIHPVGTFDIKSIEFVDIKRSKTREHLWVLSMKLETAEGQLWSFVSGFPNTLNMLWHAQPYFKSNPGRVRVTHKTFEERVLNSAEWLPPSAPTAPFDPPWAPKGEQPWAPPASFGKDKKDG